jgi:MFS transporter, DHA3 family, macrolide efflux protein
MNLTSRHTSRSNLSEGLVARPLLGNRNFVLLYSGKVVSLLGDQIYLIALAWYVLDVTHSPLAAGLLFMMGALPPVLVGPFTGVFADWFERRTILVAMDTARGVLVGVLAGLLWLQAVPLWLLYIGTFLLGTFGSVFNPASSALLPNIVVESQYARVAAADQFVWSVCSLIGFTAGGILFSFFGIVTVFAINALSYFLSGVLEACMRVQRRLLDSKSSSREHGHPFNAYLTDLAEGFKYLRGHSTILILFGCFTVSNFLLWPQALIYVPLFFNETLHASAGLLSVVLGSAFAGMIVGSFLIPKNPGKGIARRILLRGWSFCAIANTCFSIVLFPLLLRHLTVNQVAVFGLAYSVVLGFGLVFINVPVSVIVQKAVKDEFRGRVWAFLGSLSGAALPLAYLCGGLLARLVPLYVIYLCGGIAFFGLLAILARLSDLPKV